MSVRNIVKSIQDIMRQDSGVDGDAQRISQLCWMFFLRSSTIRIRNSNSFMPTTVRRSPRSFAGVLGRQIQKA